MTDIRVKIDELSPYDDLNSDKSRKNLYEVSKNTGTYSSPLYATNGSRKITQEQLREELNIKEYLVNEVIGKTNGDTLEVDKINVLNLTSNATFTLPTASLAYKGKALIIIQSNVNNYKAVINGAAQGPIIISDFRDAIIFNCVFDGTSSYDWFAISKDDSKICNRLVVVSSSTYTANANDNIQADGYFLGNVDITIPSAGIAGRCIYIHYPNGIPSSNTVNLLGGFSATLNQTDFILIRDNGSNWEAISTSQNVAVTPDLDEVTGVGNTTTNSIEVGGLVVNHPSGSGVAASITKGGNGEALTVTKTSGSGNVASFTGGTTLISQLDLTTPLADSEIASAATWNGKFNTPTGLTTNYVSKWNGSAFVDSLVLSRAGGITLQNSTVIDLQTEGKSYFEFYPLLRNTGGTPRFALDLFPETSTQFAGFVSSVINITSGGDVVSGKNTVMNGITATHRSTDGTNGNRPFVNINAIMHRPSILAVGNSGSGVHHITSQNADNYTSIVRDGASGSSPVHYSAFSQRSDGVGFSHIKSISANSGVQSRHNFNQLNTSQTTWANGFGFDIRNTLANNNASPQIVNLVEEYIIQNQGAGTVHAGKRYRYEAGNQSAASAHIMGLYRTGVIIGDTTALPNSSASLDLVDTTKGFLPNRLTTVQRLAITSPATGLQVFDSNLLTLCTFNGGSNIEANWKKYSATSLTGTYTPNTGISGTTRTTVTVTVTGAVVGQKVVANINDAMRADFVTAGSWFLDIQAYVSATDTVTITFVLSTFTTFGATSSITVNVN